MITPSHVNRPKNLSENVISLVGEHLKTIPHDESHYCMGKTNLLYFENSKLNVKTFYEMLKEFYKEKTKSKLKTYYQTYHQYCLSQFSYTVRKPQTNDVCDFCQECKNIYPNDPCRVSFNLHMRKKQ